MCSNIITMSILTKSLCRSLSTYKSAFSLENLYPTSTLTLKTLSKSTQVLPKTFEGYIPINELDITYSKSSGPGGQNVNKVNTKVDVRFHLDNAKWIPDDVRTRMKEQLQNKLTNEGYLTFKSDLTRSQQLNVADCLQKIRNCIRKAAVKEARPSEETMEKVRRRIEKATIERLREKHIRSGIKGDRRGINIE